MKIRMLLIRLCFKFAQFLKQLPVVILKPDQLIAFSKSNYDKQNIIKSWSDPSVLDSGLTPAEKKGVRAIPRRDGSLILLGVGGGREAIPLAKMGYKVTGVDFNSEMVQSSIQNARDKGLDISGIVQSFTDLSLIENTYHIAWLSTGMYSSIPSREKRIKLLKHLKRALKPEGYLYCEFQFDFIKTFTRKAEWLKKFIAFVCRGNHHYEKGDIIWADFEFFHRFHNKETIINEFTSAGFKIVYIDFPLNSIRGSAVLKSIKKTETEKANEPRY